MIMIYGIGSFKHILPDLYISIHTHAACFEISRLKLGNFPVLPWSGQKCIQQLLSYQIIPIRFYQQEMHFLYEKRMSSLYKSRDTG